MCFGPADQGHIKFVFYENFLRASNDSPAFYSAKLSPRDYVDSPCYDSVSTQDFSSCRSSPIEHSQQIEVYRSEIARLKVQVTETELQLKQQKDSYKHLSKDFQKTKRLLAEKECKFDKEIDNFKCKMDKYQRLIGQLKSSESASRCPSSDDESSNERACTESSPFGGHEAVSPALREITCTICSEYLILPTSLSCSHVFCLHCIDAWKHEYRSKHDSFSNGICPICRKEVEYQTQPLALENLVNIILDSALTRDELNERRTLVETRKKQPLVSAGCSQPLNNSYVSIISHLLNGVGRNRRSSITIPSDSDDDDDQVESEDEVYSIVDDEDDDDDDDDDDLVEIDEEIDISITLSSSNLQEVLDGHDSDADILMIENDDDDMSNDSSQVVYLLEDSEDSASETISSSDSEDSRETGSTSSRRRRRRSSMIILSDSDDSLPARRNSVTSRATLTSATLASNSNDSHPQSTHGSRSIQSSRRNHPYHRRNRSNSGNGSNNISRLHQVCV